MMRRVAMMIRKNRKHSKTTDTFAWNPTCDVDKQAKQSAVRQFELFNCLVFSVGLKPAKTCCYSVRHPQFSSETSVLLKMEARRLAILCSHLCPIGSGSAGFSGVSASNCDSGSDCDEQRLFDSEKGNRQNDCVFCKIIRGESPAFKLYEDDMCLCILDTNPLSKGHSLIIPKSHFPSLKATPPSVVAAMCSKVPFISDAIMKATACDSFNLLVNNGVAAGQVIFHTHIHIIPRKARDCLWPSESLRRRRLNLDKDTSQLVDHVREQLLLLNNSEDRKDKSSSLIGN